jgi:HAD superfamily hydrolase (TIGR01509 family)
MDGVLVDGEPLHFQAVDELLGEEGRAITFEQYQPYMGTKSGWAELIDQFGLAHPHAYYADRYRDLMAARYRERSEPLPGACQLVHGLRAAGMPLGLCSSSILPWVEACLDRIGLTGAFDAVVTGSEVDQGKPAPDIYLLAAERLGYAPERCLAIEDAPAGVASASAAGMTCWAVRTEYTQGLDLPGAARVFPSLEAVSLSTIMGKAA